MMNKSHPHYLSYLLRLWQVDGEDGPIWRASLQSPQTAERINFADLAALISFLTDKTSELSRQAQEDDNEHSISYRR
jgi:hypothetical protein